MEERAVVSSTPSQITVQIIQSTAGNLQQPETRLIQSFYSDEPGVAQTLLNISQPGLVSVDTQQAEVVDLGHIGDVGQLQDQVLQDSSAGEQGGGDVTMGDEEKDMEEEKKQAAEEIRSQIAELCHQLSDMGEECFLMSIRLIDGMCHHVGSIKGDHFCLLRQEVAQDFHNFCLGIEEERAEEGDEIQDMMYDDVDDDLNKDDNNTDGLDDEQQALMDTESVTHKDELKSSGAVKPKIIVLKRSADGKCTEVDHQYVTDIKKEPLPAVPASKTETSGENKENSQDSVSTSILFLCDICRGVFSDIKQLRQHKLDEHGACDFECNKCPRVFSLRKILERHEADAHAEGEEDKHLCDTCVIVFKNKEDLYKHIEDCHNKEKPMKCDVCEQTFVDIQRLMEHRKIHFDYACFCNKCWQGFFDYLELEVHVQSNCKYKEALYKCDICGKRFTKLGSIGKHIDTHPVHSPHVCRMCGRGFDSEKELKFHRNGAHIIRPFKCEFCEKTFKKKDSLTEHRRLHIRVTNMPLHREMVISADGSAEDFVVVENGGDDEDVEFECDMCGIVLASQSLLDQHTQQHEMATEQYKCDLCNKIFFSLDLLNLHCRREHKIVLNQKNAGTQSGDAQVCEWEGCNKTFYDRTKLRQHLKYHEQRADRIARGINISSQKSSTTCDVCGKVLKYKSYLKAHMLSHQKDHPYQCEVCGQAYPNPKRLEDHVRVHKGEKPFKCRVCEKSFTSTSLRNQHMVVHWGHKTYICDVCGKGFMSRKHFKDHMRIHAGEQPHKCETCGKDFIYYRSLVRHMLVHIDPRARPKPYKCEYCNKEYTEVTGFKHHMRAVHTGETPFQCDICGESFHRNDKLKRHIKSRHHVSKGNKELIVTTRRASHGGPVIVKAENENQEDLLQIVEGNDIQAGQNELHVDVIQQENDSQQQVFLIGLGNEGGEAAYLQETQVIEGPDGTRYIIAGSGEELQVIESSHLQHIQEGEIVEGGIVQQIQQIGKSENSDNILVMNDGGEETLSTLANMASEAQVAQLE